MTVDEMIEALLEIQKDFGKLNVVFEDNTVSRGLSNIQSVSVVTDKDRIGKFVFLTRKSNND